jgi:hypothetical protein
LTVTVRWVQPAKRPWTLGSSPFRCPGFSRLFEAGGFTVVIPPGRASRGDWQWWVAAIFVLASIVAIIVGLALLVV